MALSSFHQWLSGNWVPALFQQGHGWIQNTFRYLSLQGYDFTLLHDTKGGKLCS